MVNQTRTVRTGRVKIRRQRSRLQTIIRWLQIAVCLFFGIGIGAAVGIFISVSRDLPKVSAGYSPPEATKILSSDGVLLATIGEQNREFVPLKDIPENLQKATIAIEDSRFYEHSGIDFKGILRAVVENIRGGRMSQGGSTITQQLARNVYLTPKKVLSRKAREAVLAIMIERSYTKQKILELYLNQVYYGSSAYGVEAASRIYFGKEASKLNLAECALIAGLPQRPTYYSPHENLEDAITRRDIVLSRMEELRFITPEQAASAKAETPKIIPLKPAKYRSKAPYFTDYVRKYLREKYDYGEDLINRGGLRVYTTVNYKMQVAAQEALTRGINEARRAGKIHPTKGNGALICIEANTGYIRAMVGGADYTKSEFNRAVQAKRQPGSSFKAFVYTAAVDKFGWDADHIVKGGTFYWRPDPSAKPWSPRNYDNRVYGSMPMRRAVARSVNIPAIKTAMEVGLNEVIRYARMMGVTSEIKPYPALAIGGIGGISVLEMAGAYNVFASSGNYVEPTPIKRVLNSEGQLLNEGGNQPRQVLPERTVKVMDEMFRDVVVARGGTGYAVRDIPNARGKTGTTNNDVDAWFIGYVPGKMVTAVWTGNDDHTPMRNVWGGNVCAPIWKEYMRTALAVYDSTIAARTKSKHKQTSEQKPSMNTNDKPTDNNQDQSPIEDETEQIGVNGSDEDINPPVTEQGTVHVRICDESQLVATRWCPSWHREEFIKGNEPSSYCNIHKRRTVTGEGTNPQTERGGGTGGELRLTPPPPILTDR